MPTLLLWASSRRSSGLDEAAQRLLGAFALSSLFMLLGVLLFMLFFGIYAFDILKAAQGKFKGSISTLGLLLAPWLAPILGGVLGLGVWGWFFFPAVYLGEYLWLHHYKQVARLSTKETSLSLLFGLGFFLLGAFFALYSFVKSWAN